jgi:hypothetical protein
MTWRILGRPLAAKNRRGVAANAMSIRTLSSAHPGRASQRHGGKKSGGTRRDGTTPGTIPTRITPSDASRRSSLRRARERCGGPERAPAPTAPSRRGVG